MSRARLTIVVAVLLVGVAAGSYFVWNYLTTHRVTIRNDADRELVDVNITIYGFGGDLLLYRRVKELHPGNSVCYGIKHKSPDVYISFALGGQRREEELLLEKGGDWLITINDRGEVEVTDNY
jgi:hypothetical protein